MRRKAAPKPVGAAILLGALLTHAGIVTATKPAEEVYLNSGARDVTQGRWESARDDYRRAVDANPHCSDAFVGLGRAYLKIGVQDRAHEAFAEALRIDRRSTVAEDGWRQTRGEERRQEWFADLSEQAVRSPDNPDIQETFAEELLLRGRNDEAATAAEVVLQFAPKLSHAEYILGRVALAQGRDDEARRHLLTATREDHTDDDAWAALGDLARKRSNYVGAIESYQHAVKAAPEHAEYWQNLAQALDAAGRHADARAEQAQAIDHRADAVR